MPRPRRPRLAAAPKAKAPRVLPHAFEPDEDLAPDFFERRTCGACGKLGADGDAQHPHGALPLALARHPPAPPAARELDARRLGEPP